MSSLVGVTSENINKIWPGVTVFLQKAIDAGNNRYTLESIYKGLINRDLQLWVATDGDILAACVTEIRVYPSATVCLLFLCGGHELKKWSEHVKIIENWAKNQGCDAMELIGRKGWVKVLSGYTETQTILGKAL